MTTYTRTQPTQAELAAYLRRHPGQRYPAVHFATCDTCGARLWMSGLGKGSHERGARHNSVALRRCGAVHPSHPEVLCDELADHTGQHFASFYMRSWDNDSAGEPEPSGFGPGTMLAAGASVPRKGEGRDLPPEVQAALVAYQVAEDAEVQAFGAYLDGIAGPQASRLNQEHQQASQQRRQALQALMRSVPEFHGLWTLYTSRAHHHTHLKWRRGAQALEAQARFMARKSAEADGFTDVETRALPPSLADRPDLAPEGKVAWGQVAFTRRTRYSALTWAAVAYGVPCTHPHVTVVGDQEPGTCQACGALVRTPRADEHLADARGDRAMWVQADSGACLAEYPWPGRTLRCQRPAGHDGQHEDGDDDTGEQWAWGGPHNDAHLTFPDGDATWTPAGSPQDAPGRLEGTRAVSQYPGAPVACCDWALVAYQDLGLLADSAHTSARTCAHHPKVDPDDWRMAQRYLLERGRCQVCDSLMGNHHDPACRMGPGIVSPDLTGWAPGEVTEAYGK